VPVPFEGDDPEANPRNRLDEESQQRFGRDVTGEDEQAKKKQTPASAVVDLSGEDITGLDDALVADLLEEAIAEATESAVEAAQSANEEAPPSTDDPEDGAEEVSLGSDLQDSLPSEEPDNGKGLAESALLPGGAMMLSDEDADLAFPSLDDEDGSDDGSDALEAQVTELTDEVNDLRERVAELADAELEHAIEKRRLMDEAATAESQLEVYKGRLVQMKDNQDSFRERMQRERDDGVLRSTERVLRAFLPVLDNMELALQHAEATNAGDSLLEGVSLILQQLRKTLLDQGVEAIELNPGDCFDPKQHDAVVRQPGTENPPNTVTEVLRTGYVYGERLLRAARVAVAMGEETPEPVEDDEAEAADEEAGEVDGSEPSGDLEAEVDHSADGAANEEADDPPEEEPEEEVDESPGEEPDEGPGGDSDDEADDASESEDGEEGDGDNENEDESGSREDDPDDPPSDDGGD